MTAFRKTKNQDESKSSVPSSRISKLAIFSLIFSLLGIFSVIIFYPLLFISSFVILIILGSLGIILGVISLRKIKSKPGLKGKGSAWAGIIIGILGVLFWTYNLVYAKYFSFCRKSPFAEARQNLRAIYTAQVSYFSDYGHFARSFKELEWSPPPRAKYLYLLSAQGLSGFSNQPIQAFVEKDRFLILAIGNIDDDPTLDIWSVNQEKEIIRLIDDEKQ